MWDQIGIYLNIKGKKVYTHHLVQLIPGFFFFSCERGKNKLCKKNLTTLHFFNLANCLATNNICFSIKSTSDNIIKSTSDNIKKKVQVIKSTSDNIKKKVQVIILKKIYK